MKKSLEDNTLYLTDDRYVCSNIYCAGATALATGKTIHGVELLPIVELAVVEMVLAGDQSLSCECGDVTVSR